MPIQHIMAMKRFGCTDSLLMLPISGAFVSLLGVVLLILYIVARGLTASLYHVEGTVPTYVASVLLILTGAVMIILLKKRPYPLIYLAIVLNCVTFCVCALQAVSIGIAAIPFLGSFSACVYHTSLSQCQCYILSAHKENNSTGIIVPGADSEKVTFQDVRSCTVIEHTMIDVLYILCIIYGFAGIATLVTDTLSFLLLCSQRRATKEAHALPTVGFVSHRRTLTNAGESQTSNGHRFNPDPSNTATVIDTGNSTTSPGRRATIGHHEGRNQRPHAIQRSTSTSATHGRQQTRQISASTSDTHGSGTGRGAATPIHPNQSQRQGRPPALVRGGYLQSHVNGPSIPVYIIPGSSNEAYIALTDLPSLHLPSLDTMPAYVSEISDMYPTDQPPPYSPTPDEHHPSSFSVIMESPPSTPTIENGRNQPQRLAFNEDDSIHQPSVEQVQHESLNLESILDVLNTAVAGTSTESVGAINGSTTPSNNTQSPGSDRMDVVQTSLVSESQGQTSPGDMSQESQSESRQRVETSPEGSMDIEQSHQHVSSEMRRRSNDNRDNLSPRIDNVPAQHPELPIAPSGQIEVSQPGNSQPGSARERESEERATSSQNLVQGARPKHRQDRYRTEEAYTAHTRSSSPSRRSSPNRRSSPSRRSVSPCRRQTVASVAAGENLSRQPVREDPSSREVTRSRSNSRGKQRHLPDILPRIDRLQNTEIKSSNAAHRQPPAENLSIRVRPHQKKHKQQSSEKKRELSPKLSSRQDAVLQRPPKNPQNTQSQTAPKNKSKERQTKHNRDSKRSIRIKIASIVLIPISASQEMPQLK